LEQTYFSRRWSRLEEVCGVTLTALDRDNRLLVIDADRRFPSILDDLEAAGLADFTRHAVLDPTHRDFLTRKLRRALRAIGNPQIARSNMMVAQATGRLGGPGAHRTAHTPAADFLWSPRARHASIVERDVGGVRAALKAAGLQLNASQWDAWTQALSRRLQL